MVEISRLRFQKFQNIANTDDPNDAQFRLISEAESNDSDVEDVYETIESDFRLREYNPINGGISQNTGVASDFEALEKLQETLSQITLSLGQFLNDRLGFMERNIFRIINGG